MTAAGDRPRPTVDAVPPTVPVEPEWRTSLDALLWCGDVAGATRFLEPRALPLVALGAAGELVDAISSWPPPDRPLIFRFAEATTRLPTGPPSRRCPVPLALLPAWEAEVMRAYFGWRRDLAAGTLDGSGPSLPAGRSDYGVLRAALAPGLATLAAAGFDEWRLLWSIAVASAWSRCTLDEFDATIPSLRSDAAELAARQSPYAAWAWAGLASVELLAGDLGSMATALDHADAAPDPTGYAPATARTTRALAELFTDGPSTALVDELTACEALWRLQSPVTMVGLQGMVATVLLDHGWIDQAMPFTARAGPGMFLHRDLFSDRARVIADGDADAAGRLLRSTDAARRIGWGRWATAQRLRIARDCLRHGLTEPARRLRTAALDDVATSASGPSRWEAELLAATAAAEAIPTSPRAGTPPDRADASDRDSPPRSSAPPPGGHPPVPAPAAAAPPDAPDALLVLQPDLVVRRRGLVTPVSPQAAQLLVLLVVERRPLTVDQVIDALWPVCTLAEGRDRLKRALYRVRQALDLRADELVVRRGDGLALVPGERWYIDAWSFWDAPATDHEHHEGNGRDPGDAVARRRAPLDAYGADLCHRQFAYDDTITEARFRFAARWVDLAAGVLDLDAGAVDPVEVAARARRYGLLTAELAERLAASCRARGRPVEAASLMGEGWFDHDG